MELRCGHSCDGRANHRIIRTQETPSHRARTRIKFNIRCWPAAISHKEIASGRASERERGRGKSMNCAKHHRARELIVDLPKTVSCLVSHLLSLDDLGNTRTAALPLMMERTGAQLAASCCRVNSSLACLLVDSTTRDLCAQLTQLTQRPTDWPVGTLAQQQQQQQQQRFGRIEESFHLR